MLDRMFWVGSLVLFAGFIMVLIAHGAIPDLRAEAQEDTRHATFPPDADRILIWNAGHFEVTCTGEDRKRWGTITHGSGPYNKFLVMDFRDNSTDYIGNINVINRHAQFHILATELNNTDWRSYGVAHAAASICPGGDEIFDFAIDGKCDGSAISIKTSDSTVTFTPRVSSDPAYQYYAWCGYIPDDLDRLNNKIF